MPVLAFELRLVSMRFVGRADGGGGSAAVCCSQGKDMAQDLRGWFRDRSRHACMHNLVVRMRRGSVKIDQTDLQVILSTIR